MNTTKETTPAPPTDGAQLLDQVSQSLTRYVVLPSPEALTAVTLWIAATHAATAWNTAARLVIRAPEKRCGKSRLLDIIEALSHRPIMTVNASPTAIYRLIGHAEGDPPTLLIDEADTIFGSNAGPNEDIRGLLNAGHQRNRPALRWNMKLNEVEHLDTYAMAALAGIGRMPDTIEDRAVIIKMRRRAPQEMVHPYRLRRDQPDLHGLREQLHEWMKSHTEQLKQAVPEMPLEDRAADTWEALIATADLAKEHWPQTARHAATTLNEQKETATETNLNTRLLQDCKAIIGDRKIVSSADLLSLLRADPEAPWETHGQNGLTVERMASILRQFDIHTGRYQSGGERVRGYLSASFEDAWNRYLSYPSEKPGHPGHPGHTPHLSSENGWPGSDRKPGHIRVSQSKSAMCIKCRVHHRNTVCPSADGKTIEDERDGLPTTKGKSHD